jgi:hypothetical protein
MMKRFTLLLLTLAMIRGGSAMAADDTAADPPGKDKTLACVTHKAEVRYVGLAYNHLVHFQNKCHYPVTCNVKTDVNPKPETVKLAPNERKTHLTFRGSPARVFKADVKCRRADQGQSNSGN